MARRIAALAVLALASALGGCAPTARSVPVPAVTPRPVAPVIARPAPAAPVALLGSSAAAIVARFGPAALDVEEGSARKLQFSGQSCVLDLYLYPRDGRGEPVVTHVDARDPEGRDADSAACAASLTRR